MRGNDNKVGICGEFWAKYIFCNLKGYELCEVPPSNNKGYDFSCKKDGQELKVSVKVITDENQRGRSCRLQVGYPWDVVLIIHLKDDLMPLRYGLFSRQEFEKAKQAKVLTSDQPMIHLRWLGKNGWINKYGKVESFNT